MFYFKKKILKNFCLLVYGNDNLDCFEMVVVEYCSNWWNFGWFDCCFFISGIIRIIGRIFIVNLLVKLWV